MKKRIYAKNIDIEKSKNKKIFDRSTRHRRMITAFQSKIDARRSYRERFIDGLVEESGSLLVFFLHAVFFIFWILLNLNWIPFIKPVDPYPFNFLTTLVSLEAIVLTIFLLMR